VTFLGKKLLGAKVEQDIYESFGEVAWRQKLSVSQLLRKLITENLKKNGVKVKAIKIEKIKDK